MDRDTRNAIERATQQARTLLEDDFASQLERPFDVLRSGVAVPPKGRKEVIELCRLVLSQVTRLLRTLVAGGKLVRHGDRKGATYARD